MSIPTVENYPPLLSLAVHEVRTPASVVSGYLRMLQRDPELNERQRKMVDEAEKSCRRLVEIVAELSDIGKLDSGVAALARQRIDFFTLTREVAARVQEGRDRDVRLAVRGPDAGAPIVGDGPRLRQAVDGVLCAILREHAGPATIVAELRLEDGAERTATLVVAEDVNVPAARAARPGAFDEQRGGLGLVLPLARRTIAGLGGAIWSPAEPDALSRGAILVRLPLAE